MNNTTLIIQLGHVPVQTFTLRPPENEYPHLNTGLFALLREHNGRKFAYRTRYCKEWDHGKLNSMYEFIKNHTGVDVMIRFSNDIGR